MNPPKIDILRPEASRVDAFFDEAHRFETDTVTAAQDMQQSTQDFLTKHTDLLPERQKVLVLQLYKDREDESIIDDPSEYPMTAMAMTIAKISKDSVGLPWSSAKLIPSETLAATIKTMISTSLNCDKNNFSGLIFLPDSSWFGPCCLSR